MILLAMLADYSVDPEIMKEKIFSRIIESAFLTFIFYLTHQKRFKKRLFLLSTIAIFSLDIFLLNSYSYLKGTDFFLLYNTADVLILISIFFLFGLNFQQALIIAFLNLVIFLTYIYYNIPLKFTLYSLLFFYTIILTAIGAYLIELHNRKLFLRKILTKKLLHELHTISKRDPLTQLFNRLGFNEIFDYHYNKFLTEKNILGVILIDIDNFKVINDTYGHITGDSILKTISKLLQDTEDSHQTICRWGGEEFFILLENCNKEKLLHTANTILSLINTYQFETVGHCTVSIGATLIKENDTKSSLIHRVDQALYKAKAEGKNKVVYK